MIRLVGTASKDGQIDLYYSYDKGTKNYFKMITSDDGFAFNGVTKYVIVTDPKGREEAKYDCRALLSVSKKIATSSPIKETLQMQTILILRSLKKCSVGP